MQIINIYVIYPLDQTNYQIFLAFDIVLSTLNPGVRIRITLGGSGSTFLTEADPDPDPG